MDVLRRALMQYLKDGNDPRDIALEAVQRSTIEQHGGLYYVIVRGRSDLPPLKVYRLVDDAARSLKGLERPPRPIKDKIENEEVLLMARMKKASK